MKEELETLKKLGNEDTPGRLSFKISELLYRYAYGKEPEHGWWWTYLHAEYRAKSMEIIELVNEELLKYGNK